MFSRYFFWQITTWWSGTGQKVKFSRSLLCWVHVCNIVYQILPTNYNIACHYLFLCLCFCLCLCCIFTCLYYYYKNCTLWLSSIFHIYLSYLSCHASYLVMQLLRAEVRECGDNSTRHYLHIAGIVCDNSRVGDILDISTQVF